MKKRTFYDPIIVSIFPHLLSLIYLQTYTYSIIIFFSTFSSCLWHFHCENRNYFFILDYLFALILTAYEIIYTKNMYITISLNIIVFSINKITDYLSNNNIIYYEKGHVIYHLFSSVKTIYISKNINF